VSGRIVVLNGASSTGKTSLANAFFDLRAEQDEFWFRSGVDDVLARLSFPWLDVGWPSGAGAHADHGLRIANRAGRTVIEVGPMLRALLHTYQDGVAANARRGVDMLVDEACLDEELMSRWRSVLSGFAVLWVAVRCDVAEMARREACRGDRPLGLAAAQAEVVHRGALYDLELDTTVSSTAELASRLARAADGLAVT
jgi:chloramphenicol 3-O phosphotransferase